MLHRKSRSHQNENSVRNDQSYAHDNDVLNKAEATLAVRIMTATISFIDEMEG